MGPEKDVVKRDCRQYPICLADVDWRPEHCIDCKQYEPIIEVNLNKYQMFVRSIAKKFDDKEKELLTWGLGISGEAGDVASCIKKTVSHKNDQTDGIKENLGDTLWYIAAICNFFGWSIDEVIDENMKKLKKRYPKGFTEKDAKRERIDWSEKQ